MDHNSAIALFRDRYSADPAFVVRAPGRVNLIGEHTDYNDGFVLPMAIDRSVWIAGRARKDGVVALYSADLDKSLSFPLDDFANTGAGWAEYVKGVAHILLQDDHWLSGWEGVSVGNVPIGSGLSSSAALELAVMRAFHAASDFKWDPVAMAKGAQMVEHVWMGVQIGIMDQLISATGVADHAVLIDCRSLEATPVPLPDGTAVVILDTGTRRGLVDSAYNERLRECQAAAAHAGVPMLRDLNSADLPALANGLDATIFRRARHVVTENERTTAAADALRAGDAPEVGRLMNASHASLKADYEVTGEALDTMVAIAQAQPGCFGARMSGAGFGGCAVALVEEKAAATFAETVATAYDATGIGTAAVYVCYAVAGAERII